MWINEIHHLQTYAQRWHKEKIETVQRRREDKTVPMFDDEQIRFESKRALDKR